MKRKIKRRSPVAKWLRKFNLSSVFRDRKKAEKSGYNKHKTKQTE